MPVRKVYGSGPGKVTLVLPDGAQDHKRAIRGYYHKPEGPPVWHYCPKCGAAYDKAYAHKGGCYCTPVYDGHSEPVSWAPTPLVKMPDQEAAEAAFAVGGIGAVCAVAEQLAGVEVKHGRET